MVGGSGCHQQPQRCSSTCLSILQTQCTKARKLFTFCTKVLFTSEVNCLGFHLQRPEIEVTVEIRLFFFYKACKHDAPGMLLGNSVKQRLDLGSQISKVWPIHQIWFQHRFKRDSRMYFNRVYTSCWLKIFCARCVVEKQEQVQSKKKKWNFNPSFCHNI